MESREEEKEKDGHSESEESEGLSDDSETIRAKRRAKRKYPRSKIQDLVDRAEDNVYDTFELDVSNLNAPHISSRVYDLHELKTLNISKNRLSRINPDIQYLDKLEMLDASFNQISSIPKEIESLTSLKDVNLSRNRLDGYPGQFYKLKTLERLDLSYNEFEEIPVETGNLELLQETGEWEIGIGMLTNLRYLDFRACRLKDWSTQLEKLENLQELYLSDNQLIEIPAEIADLKSLKILHLSGNKLKSLPNEIYSLPLEEFRVQTNELLDFPECHDPVEEVHAPHMQYMDLSNNSLESIDRRLSIFNKLKTLMGQYNHLKYLSSDCFVSLTSLTYVDLSHNQLSEIPNSLGNASKLTYCDLSFNNLTEVPACFFRSGHLKILKLDHNMINEVSGKVMGMLNDLERLELQYNLIKGALPPLMFAVKKLVYVDLSHNQIEGIPADLGNWTKIIHMNLSYNNISYIPDSLGELKELTFLEMDHNSLFDVPQSIGQLKKLNHLTLQSNRLSKSPHILELLPQLHYIDLSWNLDIPPHLLPLLMEPDDTDNITSQSKKKTSSKAPSPFQRKTKRILHVDREQQSQRLEVIERRIQELMGKLDAMNLALQRQEQDFIGNQQNNANNFSVLLSWSQRLRQHFSSHRDNIHELEAASAQQLKEQKDSLGFNTILVDTLANLQKYKSNLRDRVFFSNLALKQNQVPKWFSNFLDFVAEQHQKAPELEAVLISNHADDVLSELFLGLDLYPLLEEICSILHELNLLALIEELDYDLCHLDSLVELEEKKEEGNINASSISPENSMFATNKSNDNDPDLPLIANTRSYDVSLIDDAHDKTSGPQQRMSPIIENVTAAEMIGKNMVEMSPTLDVNDFAPAQESELVVEDNEEGHSSRVNSADVMASPDRRERKSFLSGFASPSSKPSTPSVSNRNSGQTSSVKQNRMFFSFSSSSKSMRKSDAPSGDKIQAPSSIDKTLQTAQLKIDSLGIDIESNDYMKVLHVMKHFIDLDILTSYHYSCGKGDVDKSNNSRGSFQRIFSGFGANIQSWKELPHMNVNFAKLQEEDKNSLYDYLSPKYSLVRENPYGRTFFSLYFEANQVLSKCLVSAVDYLTRGIRSVERENEEPFSCIDLANRDHFYQFHVPDEEEIRERQRLQEKKLQEEKKRQYSVDFSMNEQSSSNLAEVTPYDPNVTEVERIEDFGDLLRDVYNALSQDKKLSDKKDKQLSLKDRYKKHVQDFLVAFEDKGGLDEMKHVFENEFKIKNSEEDDVAGELNTEAKNELSSPHHQEVSSPSSSSHMSRRPSYIMRRTTSNLQESFNARRTSQGNLKKKLAAWAAAEDAILLLKAKKEPLLGKDKILGRHIVNWLANVRKLFSGWLIQCLENNAMILSLRGIDVQNYDCDFLRNFHILRDTEDPVYKKLMTYNKKNPLMDETEIVNQGMPTYVTNYLLSLTRRYMLQRARGYQIFGHYFEAMRAFDSAITLHNENLPQEFFINYVKVCMTNGHYFRAQLMMEKIIRKFVMPKYPDILDQNKKKQAGKLARQQIARSLLGQTKNLDNGNEEDEEEDELFSDVQILPVEREIAILTRFANTQANRLHRMGLNEEDIRKKSMYPHAFLEVKKEEDMDKQELSRYFASPPELRYGRKTNIKQINALRLEEEKKVQQAQAEEELRWEILRKCKDVQFRSRVALDAEELLETFGIGMDAGKT